VDKARYRHSGDRAARLRWRMPYVRTTYDRAALYELVWTEPVRSVAKRYGVSHAAITNACDALAIPLPPLGHWARKAAGREVDLAPLPDAPPGLRDPLTVMRWRPEHAEPIPDDVRARAMFETTAAAAVTVPTALERPHPLVASAASLLRRATPDDYGRVHCANATCLDLTVGPASLDRALRLMDALLRAAEQRGYRVEVTPHETLGRRHDNEAPPNQSRVVVDGVPIALRLFEKSTETRATPPTPPGHLKGHAARIWIRLQTARTARRTPNGLFELTLTGRFGTKSVFVDRGDERLEHRLNDVLAKLPAIAHRVRVAEAEHEAIRRREADAVRRRENERRRAQEAKEREEEFVAEVDRWQRARSIREYASELRALAGAFPLASDERTRLDQRAAWAAEYAASIDPLVDLCAPPDDESEDDGGLRRDEEE